MKAAVLAWSIAAMGLVCVVVYHVLDFVNAHRHPPPVVGSIVGITYLVVGALIASRRPRNPIGWIYVSCLALISFGGSGNVSDQYVYYAIVTNPGSLLRPEWVGWAGQILLTGGFSTVLIFSLLLFPDGRLPSARWRPVAIAGGVVVVSLMIGTALVPAVRPQALMLTASPIVVTGLLLAVVNVASAPVLLITIGVLGAAIVAITRRFLSATGVERQQLKWFAYGTAVIPGVALIGVFRSAVLSQDLSDAIGRELWPLSAAGIPVATAIALLRYRLYDIDILINRTLVYAATTAAIAGAFFGGIVVLQAVLRPVTSGSEVAVAASTLISFALFQPLRRWIQRGVDRRFYRGRYDAQRTLDDFSVRLRDQVALDAVRADLLDAVRETVQPAHASVWLRE